ncbi:MAG: hypothetical protein QOD77_866 [Thermoplasmata archaeon]|jgi:hypothetical protein|nr:hypothetical protein [Thermoplasmata archaeon]
MKLTYVLLAAMFASATLAVQGAPYDVNCGAEDNTNADGDKIECLTVLGPGSVTVKPVIGVGAGVCTDPALPLPFPCFTAGTANPGAAIFPGNALPALPVNVAVSVWAEWTTGQFVTGFEMTTCNDRDFDSICTNVNDNDDQLRSDYSNQAQVATAACSDPEKSKDDKDCGLDPTDAERANFCMMPAIPGMAPNPWNAGQIVVFIGNWVSADPFTPNIGAGISAGTYDVWMKVGAVGCTPPQCDDKVDNADADTTIDFDDSGCSSYDDTSEEPECSDGIDNNDQDGLIDAADPQCISPITMLYNPADNNEKM